MDWTAEMTQSMYQQTRTGAASVVAGNTVGFGGPALSAVGGPYICKQVDNVGFVQDENGNRRKTSFQIACYQPVAFDDVIYPDGVDQTNSLNGLAVIKVTHERLLGDDSQILYVVVC